MSLIIVYGSQRKMASIVPTVHNTGREINTANHKYMYPTNSYKINQFINNLKR